LAHLAFYFTPEGSSSTADVLEQSIQSWLKIINRFFNKNLSC
jgi:hypothetical protein